MDQSDGEHIIAVVIDPGREDTCPVCKGYINSWDNKCSQCNSIIDRSVTIPILTWEEALPELEKEFDSGYGLAGCPAIYAYTKTWVIFVSEYDGSTMINRIPRNPTANINPIMPGGG